MKNSSLLYKFFLLITLVISSGCVNSDPEDKLLKNIANDLSQGKTVIIYQMSNNNQSTVQYADWSVNLNDFISSKATSFKVYPSNSALNSKLTSRYLTIPANYTIFLKKDKPSYLYEGVIVEAMVYMSVDNAYNDANPSPMYKAFLSDLTQINF